jgi:hypothetical protein
MNDRRKTIPVNTDKHGWESSVNSLSLMGVPLRGMKAKVKYHIPVPGMRANVKYHKVR